MQSVRIKYFLFISLMGLLWAPHLWKQADIIKEKPLKGYFEIPDSTFILNDTNWFSGSFQNKYEKWFNYNMGLHITGVRINNQINFWMKEHFPGVVIGKENEFMESNYIDAYLGKDFIGADSIERECTRIHILKDSLEKKGIRFFVAIAPNKSRSRAKYIPDFYTPEIRKKGNYEYYLEGFQKHGILFVDFQKWFELIDDTSRYPIYSNLGVHWGNYGAMLCSDSLLKYIQSLVGRKINIPVIRKVFFSEEPGESDYDLANVYNLMFNIKPRDPYVGFSWDFVQDTTNYFPDVMVVGDSYYWNIMNFGIPKLFSKNFRYLYYNSMAYYNDGQSKPVEQLDIKKEVFSQKVVFYLYTEPNLKNLGNGFAGEVLKPSERISSEVFDFERIRKDEFGNSLSSEKSFSGKFSSKLTSKNEYGQTIIKYLKDLKDLNEVHVKAKIFSLENLSDVFFVMEILDSDGNNISWIGKELKMEKSSKNEWRDFETTIIPPVDVHVGKKIKLYFWNKAKKTFFVDDVQITY